MYIIKLGKMVAGVSFTGGKSTTSFRCVNEVGYAAVGCPVFAAEFNMIDAASSVHNVEVAGTLRKHLEDTDIPSIVAAMSGGSIFIDSSMKNSFFHTVETGSSPRVFIQEIPYTLKDGRKAYSFMIDCMDASNLEHIDFFIGDVEDVATGSYLCQFFNKVSEISDGLLDDVGMLFRLIRDLNNIIYKDDGRKCEIRVASFDFKNEARLLGFFPADK